MQPRDVRIVGDTCVLQVVTVESGRLRTELLDWRSLSDFFPRLLLTGIATFRLQQDRDEQSQVDTQWPRKTYPSGRPTPRLRTNHISHWRALEIRSTASPALTFPGDTKAQARSPLLTWDS